MTTRSDVLSRLRAAEAEDFELFALNPAHRWVLVFLLDDDTQTVRLVTSAPDITAAQAQLVDPPDGLYLPEYLMDLDAELAACVHTVYEDGEVEPSAFPFDGDHLAFA